MGRDGGVSTPAERFLRDFQRRAWEANPPPNDSLLWEHCEISLQVLERLRTDPGFRVSLVQSINAAHSIDASVYVEASPYEDPIAYQRLRIWVDAAERSVVALHGPLQQRPLFGTAVSRRVNAITVAVPNPTRESTPDYVVVFDLGLFPFISRMLNVFLNVSSFVHNVDDETTDISNDPEVVRSFLSAHPELVERAADDLRDFVLGTYRLAEPKASELHWQSDAHRRLHHALYFLIGVFAVAHEYSHILKGHLAASVTSGAAQDILFGWVAECEADAGGTEVVLDAAPKYGIDPSMGLWAIEAFFASIQMVELAEAIIEIGSLGGALEAIHALNSTSLYDPDALVGTVSHPPALLRRKAINMVLRRSVTDDTYETLIGAVQAFRGMEASVFESVFLAVESKLIAN